MSCGKAAERGRAIPVFKKNKSYNLHKNNSPFYFYLCQQVVGLMESFHFDHLELVMQARSVE